MCSVAGGFWIRPVFFQGLYSVLGYRFFLCGLFCTTSPTTTHHLPATLYTIHITVHTNIQYSTVPTKHCATMYSNSYMPFQRGQTWQCSPVLYCSSSSSFTCSRLRVWRADNGHLAGVQAYEFCFSMLMIIPSLYSYNTRHL